MINKLVCVLCAIVVGVMAVGDRIFAKAARVQIQHEKSVRLANCDPGHACKKLA